MKSKFSKSENWDNIFKIELKEVSEKVKEIIRSRNKTEIEQNQLKLIADDFFSTFNKSPIPVRAYDPTLEYSPEMVSTAIILPYGCLMVPYFFVEVFREDLMITFDEEFSQELKWLELVGLLYQKWFNKRKKSQ